MAERLAQPDSLTEEYMAIPRTKWTPKKTQAILDVYRNGGTAKEACRVAGISRSALYKRRHDDPEFDADIREAEDEGTDLLEAEAINRALDKSDTLLIFLLKGRRKERYGERQAVELSGAEGAPLVINIIGDDA